MMSTRTSALFAAVFAGCLQAQPDLPRQDVRVVTAGRTEYTIQMGGNADAANTRDPVVYAAWKPGYEPMRAVKLENVGDTDVVNPWVIVNGRRDWRTTANIAREALRTYGDPAAMSDREKARAVWEFLRRNRFHATTGDLEVRDPVKMFNVYGFSLCGDNAPVLMELWQAVGLKTRRGYPIGHCVAEAWYEGGWHMMDGDESILFLDRDNRTVLPEKAVARDHDLSKRAYKNEYLASLYNYDATHAGDFPGHDEHRMDLTLRPGESIEWRWAQGEKQHYAPNPALFLLTSTNLHQWGPNAWATLRNGKWSYTPALQSAAAQRGVEAVNVRWGKAGASPAEGGKPASLQWRIAAPYVMVGGALRAHVVSKPGDRINFSVSHDGRTWTPLPTQGADISASLDAYFPSPGDARYQYFVRVEMESPRSPATIALESISMEADLQMAPLSMPSLELGANRIQYTDESGGARSVRAIFEWSERTSAHPAETPARAISPADGAEAEGTAAAFRWSPVPDAAAYHFQLADEPGIRWALSPAFDVVQPEAVWKPLSPGLLTPGRRYYWHVRAKSKTGVWGAWSRTWSFVPQAPGTPLSPRFEERDPGKLTLVWERNPAGRPPAQYRVYASDEKGFTVSDKPYEVQVGNQKSRGLFAGKTKTTFEPNFLAETADASLQLSPVHAFYRVVALDGRGNRSGSSDYVEAPRPWIYTEAPRTAKVGQPYRYVPRTIRSIGDLTYRHTVPDEQYQSAYWDADEPVFSIDSEMPRCGNFDAKWLTLDPKTGTLSGTPGEKDAGEYQINLRVEIKGKAHVQSIPIKVIR